MVMQRFPKLDPQARQLLEIIVSNTSIDGSTLLKYMGANRPDEILPHLRELQKYDLVEVGGAVTPEGLPFARFGVRPSAKEYLYSVLRQDLA